MALVIEHDLAHERDDALMAGACELVLEALVARRKISRNDAGSYRSARRATTAAARGAAVAKSSMGGMSA